MAIQEIIIISAIPKTSIKGIPYLYITSNNGKFSCWNQSVFNQFVPGRKYKVQTEQKGQYTNILGIEQELGIVPASEIREPFREAREEKGHLMLTAYMKDQVVAGINFGATRGIDLDTNALWELAYKNVTEAYKKLRDEFK